MVTRNSMMRYRVSIMCRTSADSHRASSAEASSSSWLMVCHVFQRRKLCLSCVFHWWSTCCATHSLRGLSHFSSHFWSRVVTSSSYLLIWRVVQQVSSSREAVRWAELRVPWLGSSSRDLLMRKVRAWLHSKHLEGKTRQQSVCFGVQVRAHRVHLHASLSSACVCLFVCVSLLTALSGYT